MRIFEAIKRKDIAAVILFSLAALFLRLYKLGFCDFWYDEIFSIDIAKAPFLDWNPPLYFVILHYWIKIFGVSEFYLRLPSVIFSVACVPCLYILGKKLFNPRVGLWGSFIAAFSALHVWYAQEARPYSLSVLLGLVSTYFLLKALLEKKTRYWAGFILFSVLGIYANITYFHFFLIAAQLAYLIIFLKDKSPCKIVYFLPVIFLFIPILENFLTKFNYVRGGFWIPPPTFRSFITTFENFNFGFNGNFVLYMLSDIWAGLLLAGALIFVRRQPQYKQGLIFLLMLTALPVAAIFLISKILFPIYLDRGLLIFSPYYYLALAVGADYFLKTRFKAVLILLTSFLFATGLLGYYLNWMPAPIGHHLGVHLKKPFKPAIKFLEENFIPGDKVFHTNSTSRETFRFYSKDIPQYFLFTQGMIDTSWKRPYLGSLMEMRVTDLNLTPGERIWVISCDWPRKGPLDDNSRAVKSQMDKRYKLDFIKEFEGLWIFRYVNR